MHTVKVSGWVPGLKKISLTKLLQLSTCKDLAEAKGMVDALLEGGSFELHFVDKEAARAFVNQAKILGARVNAECNYEDGAA